ncbi:AraC family transcriptional regulator [Enterococcus sp. 669A]|uniref:AraC family transcriptional regulator n=1 Tax=Candidatus Enterococcus moelleringii TaxID=2815325 RepID=A0ABS3LE98_9ENTE|nr:GyrI-like domain-containing protein [Enterococcus sp. 669A]MBO1307957.1 AraC family transcriptional regulator [Enterococcus sp. 669A]
MDKKQLINQSIDYIIQHLDKGVTLEKVAAYFNYSHYYFARLFKEQTGESVYGFIKRMKLEQSAIDLKLQATERVSKIGLDYGYSSTNFSTAFKTVYHHPPAFYRQILTAPQTLNPFIPAKIETFLSYDKYDRKIRIEQLPEQKVYYERFIGNYADLKDRWFMFLDKHQDTIFDQTILYEKFYSDPASADLDHCICDLCFSADQPTPEAATVIKGGTYAVYSFSGHIDEIFAELQGVFRIWLPQSKYQMTERFAVNRYLAIDREHEKVVMELCIPITK